jgi:post-segregation antitoxin (ccd killing protein)
MSNKRNGVLYIEQELVETSRNLGLNLSKTFENHLNDLINRYSTVNSMNNSESTSKESLWWVRPDVNQRPFARGNGSVAFRSCERKSFLSFIANQGAGRTMQCGIKSLY